MWPLAAEFPGWSPYNYVLANPILLVDPDGRSPDCCPWAEFAVGFADRAAQVSFPAYGVYRSVATAPQTVSGLYDHAAKLVSGQGTLTDYLALFDLSGTARTINEVKHVRELYDAGEYEQLGVMAYDAIVGFAVAGVEIQGIANKANPANAERPRTGPYSGKSKTELLKSKASYEALIEEHKAKIEAFSKDPVGNSSPEMIRQMTKDNPSPEVLLQRAKGRIGALERQLQKQQGEFNKINQALEDLE